MAITDWHQFDRPREKLLKFGPHSLTDAELLAIFLRVGIKGKSAVHLAQDLLDYFGSLDALLKADQATFCQAKGLGEAKYVQVQAILEMSQRHFKAQLQHGQAMTQPESVARYLSHQLGFEHREQFVVLLLDQQHQLIHCETLFVGTLNQATIHPREVLKSALDHHAAAVILAHNHPSGDPTPSLADHRLTQTLVDALQLVDIRVLDHFILGDSGRWHSFAQHGQMP
jgi:DNA repair protein RadC